MTKEKTIIKTTIYNGLNFSGSLKMKPKTQKMPFLGLHKKYGIGSFFILKSPSIRLCACYHFGFLA